MEGGRAGRAADGAPGRDERPFGRLHAGPGQNRKLFSVEHSGWARKAGGRVPPCSPHLLPACVQTAVSFVVSGPRVRPARVSSGIPRVLRAHCCCPHLGGAG